jgi:hypothetical protein
VDERLEIMYRQFTWPILPNYVTPGEFGQPKSQITGYGQWCQAWSKHAASHVARGDEALATGRRICIRAKRLAEGHSNRSASMQR